MKRRIVLALACLGLAGGTSVWGVPLPPMEPVTIEGTVVEANWHPSRALKGKPGASGSLGRDRTEPAHFIVKLADYRGVNSATAWRLMRLLGAASSAAGGETQEPPEQLVLRLDHQDPQALKPGLRVRVVDYRISGDEGGTRTHYKELWIRSNPANTVPAP